jgi:hypothetical protein
MAEEQMFGEKICMVKVVVAFLNDVFKPATGIENISRYVMLYKKDGLYKIHIRIDPSNRYFMLYKHAGYNLGLTVSVPYMLHNKQYDMALLDMKSPERNYDKEIEATARVACIDPMENNHAIIKFKMENDIISQIDIDIEARLFDAWKENMEIYKKQMLGGF